MADPFAFVPEELQSAILRFVRAAPHPHTALCALVGASVGACSADLSSRVIAETLWMLGDHTIERASSDRTHRGRG